MDNTMEHMVENLKKNPAALQALLRSQDGQELLRRLTAADHGNALQQAAQGNTTEMAQRISRIMQSPEGAALVSRIRKTLQK